MEKLKSLLRGRVGGLVLCVLEVVVGVLLLIDPVGFTGGVIVAAGCVMAALGAAGVVRYFLMPPEEGAKAQLLFRGLLLVLAGVLCITQSRWFIAAFPLLTVLYAGWLLVLAAMKVQRMADMLRLKAGRWYMPALSAGMALVLAAVILWNPFGAANAVWILVGI